jgi:hypothetical protein
MARTIINAAAGGFALLVGFVACSGSSTQDVLQATSGNGASGGTSGTSGGTSGTSGGTSGTSGGTSGTSGSADSGVCTPEQEPNNTAATANVLAPVRCGNIDTPQDVDFLTFTLQPTTRSMRIKFDGKVKLTVNVEGNPAVVLTTGTDVAVPFVMGKPYYVEVQPAQGGSNISWRVELVETS